MAVPINVRGEASFKRPGDYEAYLRAEATGRASYLSSMDQFYAQLEETVREFDVTSTYKYDVLEAEQEMFGEELTESSRQFDEELEFMREQWGGTVELRERELSALEKYRSRSLGLEERKLDIMEETSERETRQPHPFGTAFEREQFDFLKQIWQGATKPQTTTPTSGYAWGPSSSPGYYEGIEWAY